jgi:hypothetical protein
MTFAWPRRYKFIATFEISAKIRHRYWNVGIFTIAAFGRAVQCVEKIRETAKLVCSGLSNIGIGIGAVWGGGGGEVS